MSAPFLPCQRCGAPLVPIADLAALAENTLRTLQARRLALPDAVPAGLLALVAGLSCHALRCGDGLGSADPKTDGLGGTGRSSPPHGSGSFQGQKLPGEGAP